MWARIAADTTVLVHLGFIVFVVAGGLLVLRRTWLALFHVPAVVWGAFVELTGTVCPLTPLEQRLRIAAGDLGYSGGFIEHYVVGMIYPAHLTANIQDAFGLFVIAMNAAVYGVLLYRRIAMIRRSGV